MDMTGFATRWKLRGRKGQFLVDRRADYLGALREPADLAVSDSGVGDLEAASEAEGLDLAVAGREVSAWTGKCSGFNPGQPHGAIFWTGSNSALNAEAVFD